MIEKGRPGPGMLAHLLVSKYQDHLPLNQQKGMFERQGLCLSISTLFACTATECTFSFPTGTNGRFLDLKGIIKTDDEGKSPMIHNVSLALKTISNP